MTTIQALTLDNAFDRSSSFLNHFQKMKQPLMTKNESKKWRNIYTNENVLSKGDDILVTIKTRSEDASELIPDRLYSCIKYELIHEVVGDFAKRVPFLLAKIKIVDAEKGTEILKNQKSILSGIIESGITPSRDEFKGKMKVQFTDVSYHHSRRPFAFQISYFLHEDLENPILVKVSPGFMVYARKPFMKKTRKCSTKYAKPSGITKKDVDILKEFTKILEDLVEQKMKTLPEYERRAAVDMVMKSFF